ncbi:adenylyltransferase and sulfurtransferase MOCS3-like [Portunus trituberculatus]|uniref:adenylyltransferase and sulfurtransferase MOCS3-like n=1 Tax=Portunus trituberculatus TaxID=210409 RepID=UPI001E1D1599|nr:adenylyltransferase and sulfurtransferase MOCS3-like [Portunus trituberculatus]
MSEGRAGDDMQDRSQWSREKLLEELQKKEEENQNLKSQLHQQQTLTYSPILSGDILNHQLQAIGEEPLTHAQVARYSRQLILPEFGPRGQRTLSAASILIVGCGGLGCPAAIYLAAAGVGRLGLIDYDLVELNNLHRQVLHTEARVGTSKALSIAQSIQALNSEVKVVPYEVSFTSSVALAVIRQYDVVLDCTDNVATRYLLNDACVLADKPLVSGSALRFEGQLTVYHHQGGPCFRCIHPKPPPPETVTNCSDGGVLGAVPGVIGCMQALEAIKIITNVGTSLSQKLLLFDGLRGTFLTVKLRGMKSTCEICGETPSIKQLIDYEQFCGAAATDKDKGVMLLDRNKRLTVEEYRTLMEANKSHVLIDVRLPVELEICSLPNCINIPLKDIDKEKSRSLIQNKLSDLGTKSVICVCRRGNDSQVAVRQLEASLSQPEYQVRDIIGGLTAWAHKIDKSMPVY